ncbi:toll/interleukin-1 receptor domain-containing protein [Planctomycetota bacterium]
MPTENGYETARLPATGQFYVVFKGEVAIFLNGKKLEYDEQSRPESYARTRDVCLHEGDVVVLQMVSRFVHRCLRMGFISKDGRLVLPLRIEHLRRVDELPLQDVNAAAIKASHTGARDVGPDSKCQQSWADLKLPLDESEWFWGSEKNKRHQLAFIVESSRFKVVGPQEGEPSDTTAPRKRFRIALSFPGEHRAYVKKVAAHLTTSVGRERVLYDRYHEAEFARPNLDIYLQELYHRQSELIAVFLCADYERKEWCGLEWRAIRDLIKHRHSSVVMPFRFDNTEIPGLFSTDGYIWIGDRTAKQVAELILERLKLNTASDVTFGTSTARSEAGIPPVAVAPGNPAEEMAQGMGMPSTSDEYEDGTNVRRDTPFFVQVSMTEDWYRPDESKCPAGWKERWVRLRARFEQLIDECCPITCVLIEKRLPPYPKVERSSQDAVAGRELLQGGGGLGLEPSLLYARDRSPLFGVFPISDVNGTPISNSAGQAFGFRFGLSRSFFVCVERKELRERPALPGGRLCDLARDGTGLLYQLPSKLAASLWRNWRGGFSRNAHSDEYLWFDALFELSWQRKAGDVLHTKRYAWSGNMSIQLEARGLFPRLPDLSSFPGSISIPTDNGYPVVWRSALPDLARASVIAIDELLERASDV